MLWKHPDHLRGHSEVLLISAYHHHRVLSYTSIKMSLCCFRDCIKGVGWEILKRAYEILSRIEEDEVEVREITSKHFCNNCMSRDR